MTYELAKQLKDAGFPQDGNARWSYPPDAFVIRRADRVYVPTLSELIEACGGGAFMLKRDKEAWRAFLTANAILCKEGSTPEEAVARLWLAINEQ